MCLDLAKNVYPGDHALICVVSDFIEQSRRISGGFQSKSNIHGSYSYQCQLYLHNTVINHSLTYFFKNTKLKTYWSLIVLVSGSRPMPQHLIHASQKLWILSTKT